jgi:hypothetical protein
VTATDQTVVLMDQDMSAEVWNQTGGAVGTDEAMRAFRDQHGGLWAAMGQWAQDIRPKTSLAHGQNRSGGIFERDRYITPTNVFDQMRLAYQAVEDDDIVSGVADTTESLAFNRVSLYAEDPAEQDVYNQIAADIELDARLREMWRELFTVSQFYCAVWWHNKEYKVRGRSDKGKRRKRTMSVRCPKAITLLDPLKILPVGMPMFNQEKLAYIATREEMEEFEKPERTDEIMNRLVVGKYAPDNEERKWIVELGIDPNRLLLLNDAIVFRHALTRPQFKRFSDIRMKSVFSLLDRKHQLEQMDRAHLIGGTNFIVVITKGSDQHPAKPEEIANLQAQVRVVARVPVLVGDHRLKVEIITPKLDQTLEPKRYNGIDARITGRLYQMFVLGNFSAGSSGDDSVKLVKVVARGMESRRHMLRRTIEHRILDPMFTMNEQLETEPDLLFHPRAIALDFDQAFATWLLDLREAREVSRDTILSQFDLSQAHEARMLEREKEEYDDIFQTINPNNQGQPGGGGAAGTPKPAAAPKAGGTPTRSDQRKAARKGGAAPGSGQGQAPRRPRKVSASEDEEGVDDDD